MKSLLSKGTVFAGGLFLAQLAVADVSLQYAAGDGEKSSAVSMKLAGGKLRTDVDANGYTVWDSQQKAFTHVMHDKQHYLQVDEATIKQLIQLAAGFMALGGAQPAELEGLANEAKVERQLIETKRKETVAGFTCQIFELTEQGKVSAQMCMVRAEALKFSAQDLNTFRSLANFGKQMADSLLGGKLARQPKWLEGVSSDWFPVRYRSLQQNKWVTDMELVSASHQKLTPEEFAAPANYQQTSLPISFGK